MLSLQYVVDEIKTHRQGKHELGTETDAADCVSEEIDKGAPIVYKRINTPECERSDHSKLCLTHVLEVAMNSSVAWQMRDAGCRPRRDNNIRNLEACLLIAIYDATLERNVSPQINLASASASRGSTKARDSCSSSSRTVSKGCG
jgi:hypothetical protein